MIRLNRVAEQFLIRFRPCCRKGWVWGRSRKTPAASAPTNPTTLANALSLRRGKSSMQTVFMLKATSLAQFCFSGWRSTTRSNWLAARCAQVATSAAPRLRVKHPPLIQGTYHSLVADRLRRRAEVGERERDALTRVGGGATTRAVGALFGWWREFACTAAGDARAKEHLPCLVPLHMRGRQSAC